MKIRRFEELCPIELDFDSPHVKAEIKRLFNDFYSPPFFIGQGPGHELPAEQPPYPTVDPDNQEFFPKPPNERTLGISGEPDAEHGAEVV